VIPTFKIAGPERDWLVALIAYRFFVADRLRVRQARKHGVGPEQLAREFGDEMRLLADLGWFDGELLEALDLPAPAVLGVYEVTLLSPVDLGATLDRLREDALAGSAYYLDPIPDVPDNERQERQVAFQLAAETCGDVRARLKKEQPHADDE
jgi:hypothetical protein